MDAGTTTGNYASFANGHIPAREGAKKSRWWMAPAALGLIAMLAISGVAVYFSLPKEKSSDGASS